MAHYNQDWDDLGRSIQDVIDRAVNSRDYQELNQTIRHVVDRVVDIGSEGVRRAVDGSARTESRADGADYQNANRPVMHRKDLSLLYGNAIGKTVKGIIQTACGIPLSMLGLMAFLGALITGELFYLGPLTITLLMLGGGGWLTYSGISTLGMVKRYRIYRRTLGQKTYCTLGKLAHNAGKSVSFVRKELRQMIGKGLFLEGHMDREQTMLITSDETYQYFEQSRLQLEEQRRQEAAAKAQEAEKPAAARDPRVQEVLDRGNAFIAEIRRCNDAIPGEEISAKIYRMEMIVRKIFERAEAHPEIVPDLKKMMDYYLPMTVKLLNAYADMDAQPVQGETIQASKREIEDTLDTLNLAFERLMDDLFQDTAMDVSSDISVLKTLLAQEGLTEDELSKMKKQQKTPYT